jgi:hypothetical protein
LPKPLDISGQPFSSIPSHYNNLLKCCNTKTASKLLW